MNDLKSDLFPGLSHPRGREQRGAGERGGGRVGGASSHIQAHSKGQRGHVCFHV